MLIKYSCHACSNSDGMLILMIFVHQDFVTGAESSEMETVLTVGMGTTSLCEEILHVSNAQAILPHPIKLQHLLKIAL